MLSLSAARVSLPHAADRQQGSRARRSPACRMLRAPSRRHSWAPNDRSVSRPCGYRHAPIVWRSPPTARRASQGDSHRYDAAREVDGGVDPSRFTSHIERALLLGYAPGLATAAGEQARVAGPAHGELSDEITPLLCQHDMPRLAALSATHPQGAGIGVEVIGRHRRQLTIAAAAA